MTEALIAEIQSQIQDHPILLYMKGSAEFPMCGFSATAAQCLKACGKPFHSINILERQDIRTTLPTLHHWPTFPQLYVNGELIGGADIIREMYESGELQTLLDEVNV